MEALAEKARRLGRPKKADKRREAIRANTQILESDADNLPALTRRGLCHLDQGDLGAAKEDLARALKLYPGSAIVREALRKVERGWDGWRGRELERARDTRSRAEAAKKKAEEAKREKERERAEAERLAEALRRVEATTSFDEAYGIGVEASKKDDASNRRLAIAALKKAYRIDPRRKVRPGEEPDPGLFEVPVRLAAVYRRAGMLYEAEKMYGWVLERLDSPPAKTGLAAVHEDRGGHLKALELYRTGRCSRATPWTRTPCAASPGRSRAWGGWRRPSRPTGGRQGWVAEVRTLPSPRRA